MNKVFFKSSINSLNSKIEFRIDGEIKEKDMFLRHLEGKPVILYISFLMEAYTRPNSQKFAPPT